MSLIQKLTEKLKNTNESTKKRIMATTLALTLTILTAVGLAGCANNSDSSTKPGTTITNPSGDNGNTDSNDNNKNDNKYENCSESLKKVMTDKYYRNLIKTSESYVNDALQVCHARDDNRYMALPFGFLEEQGYDISKIKDNVTKCYSQMYTDNNDLHIELRVLKNGYSDKRYMKYYTCYDLKYTLTNQELNELNALFTQVYPRNCSYKGCPITYYEAPLFVQELSYNKTPEVLSVAHIEINTLNTAERAFKRDKITSDGYHFITYKGPTYTNTVNKLTQHTFLSHKDLDAVQCIKKNGQISIITLLTLGTAIRVVDSDEVLYSPDSIDGFTLREQFKETYQNSFRDVTIYNCQDTDFIRLDETIL